MSPWRIDGQFRSDGLFVVPVRLNEGSFGFIRRVNMRVIGMPLDPGLNFIGLVGIDFLRQYRFTLEPDTATLILRPLRK